MAFGRGPNIVTDGLVLALDAGSHKSYPGSGTTWYDLSGNGNNGTLSNGPTFSNGSIVFDGVNDYVYINNSSTVMPTSAITVSVFTYRDDWTTTGWQNFVSKTESGGYQLGMNHPNNPSQTVHGLIYVNGAYRYVKSSSLTLTSGWHNFTVTTDGRYVYFFIDGVLKDSVDTGSTGTIQSTTSNLIIGAEPNGSTGITGQYLSGKVSNVKLYNRALTASEVLQNYNATKSRFNL